VNKSIFKNSNKSFYTTQDVKILECYRTIVPSGVLVACSKSSLTEIDISKAFTYAFSSIEYIPIFNEFDTWKPWKRCFKSYDINKLSLYMVKAHKQNLFFNKVYCIVYGVFLKYFENDVTILAYKEPSFIRQVNYKDIVTELYNRELSEDAGEDKFIKKTVANVNFGLLEKGTNRNQKSFIFNSPEEAVYYKDLYGGSISVLRKLETTKYETESPLDKGLDSGVIHFKEEEAEKKYYI
jgi:hypothetical protein